MAPEVVVNMVGDYEQRRSGKTPGGQWDRLECANNRRFRKEWPIYIAQMKRYKNDKKQGKKNFDGGNGIG